MEKECENLNFYTKDEKRSSQMNIFKPTEIYDNSQD